MQEEGSRLHTSKLKTLDWIPGEGGVVIEIGVVYPDTETELETLAPVVSSIEIDRDNISLNTAGSDARLLDSNVVALVIAASTSVTSSSVEDAVSEVASSSENEAMTKDELNIPGSVGREAEEESFPKINPSP